MPNPTWPLHATTCAQGLPPAPPCTLDAEQVLSLPLLGMMVKYFLGHGMLGSSWDQVFATFRQRYPNPYSKYVLTEDSVHQEMIPDSQILSQRLLPRSTGGPTRPRSCSCQCCSLGVHTRGSYCGPQNQTMTTFTWNINHAQLLVVEK